MCGMTVEDRKLFIGMLPKSFNESDVAELFAPFGTIEDCSVLKEGSGHSKGRSAFELLFQQFKICSVLTCVLCAAVTCHSLRLPCVGSRVVRIDPLRFLAGCHTRRLNQTLPVLSLDFLSVSVVLLARATFYVFFLFYVCSVSWLFLLGCQYQCK